MFCFEGSTGWVAGRRWPVAATEAQAAGRFCSMQWLSRGTAAG